MKSSILSDLRSCPPHQRWSLYSLSYRQAIRLLEIRLESETDKYLLLPYLFLCRHYIELSLKELIVSVGVFNQDTVSNIDTHTLVMLWKSAKEIIVPKLAEYNSGDELVQMEIIIKVHEEIDATSQKVRYPQDKKRNMLFAEFEYIDVSDIKSALLVFDRIMSPLLCILENDINEKE